MGAGSHALHCANSALAFHLLTSHLCNFSGEVSVQMFGLFFDLVDSLFMIL